MLVRTGVTQEEVDGSSETTNVDPPGLQSLPPHAAPQSLHVGGGRGRRRERRRVREGRGKEGGRGRRSGRE